MPRRGRLGVPCEGCDHRFVQAAQSPPRVDRLVLYGRRAGAVERARRALHDAAGQSQERADLLITPGGFLDAPWPRGLRPKLSWASEPQDLTGLIDSAGHAIEALLDRPLVGALAKVASFVTIGVDLFETPGDEKRPHLELVAVIDTRTGAVVAWTGKSYPTASQEGHLVQVADLSSHVIEFPFGRGLVLGCHDLNLFSPRGRASQSEGGPRRRRCDEMLEVARHARPVAVLQHPHTTDSPRIWQGGWSGCTKALPTVSTWASAVNYRHPGGHPRDSLDRVLDATRHGAGDDLIVVLLPDGLRAVDDADLVPGAAVIYLSGDVPCDCVVLDRASEEPGATLIAPVGDDRYVADAFPFQLAVPE